MEATAKKATFQKYPAYKDSGVEWLGEIPEHWDVLPAKRFHKTKKEINKTRSNDNVLSLTLRGVVNNDLDNPEGLVPKDYATYQLFNENDLVFKLIDLENISTSRVGLVHESGIMSSAYIRLVTGEDTNPKYAYYYYYSLYINEVFNKLGSGVRSTLGPNDLLNLQFLKPSLEEQTAIAAFLDDKTAKIDRAIAQKEKMITLLKERKQIIIQNAVTKGLDPNAKMKHSGVEWIGEIPEEWGVEKLKHIFYEKKKTFNPNLNCGSISYGEVVYKDDEKIPESTKASYQELLCGEFLINPLNLNYDLVSLRIGLSEIDVVVSPGYLILKPHKIIEKKYFKYLLHRYDVAYMKLLGAGVRQTISFNHISNSLLVIPTLSEQTAIVAHIETQSAKIDKAIKLQQQQIEKLKELKSTLIDSAVTGKLRVPSVQEIKVS